jgi:hypothetical protein
MLRIDFMQQCSRSATRRWEEALHDIALFGEFADSGWSRTIP